MRRYLRLWRLAVCAVLVAVLSHSGFLMGAEIGSQPAASGPVGLFELSVRDKQLTLVAEQASVKAILAAIGRQMRVEMIVRLRQDRRVTAAFTALPLQEALKRLGLSAETVIEKDPQGAEALTKIVVLDEGAAPLSPASPAAKPSPRHAKDAAPPRASIPLKLDIDPSKAPRKP